MRQMIAVFSQTLKQLAEILTRKQVRGSILIFLFMIVGSLFEMLSVSSIMPFLQALLTPEVLTGKWYISMITDVFRINDSYHLIILLALGIVVLYIVKNAFLLLSAYMQSFFSTSITRDLSTLMLRSYMKRPYSYFTSHNSADVIRGTNTDTSGVYNIILNIFKVFSELLMCIMIAVFLFITDAFMALGVILLSILCLLGVTLGFRSKMKEMGKRQREAFAACNKYAYQAVNGIKEISILQRRDFFVKEFDAAADEKRRSNLASAFIGACPGRVIEAACISSMLGVVCARVGMGIDMESFVPSLGVFAMAAFKIMPSIASISSSLNSIVFYRPTLQEAHHNIMLARTYDTRKQEVTRDEEVEKSGKSRFRETVTLKDVTWKYPESKDNILEHISFTIKRSESVAFIGASGAGKTTLADIVLGLLPPQSGTVEMDGVNIYEIPRVWSKNIGYVPQSVYLLDDTIRNNISFGLDKEEISEERIWKALDMAQMKDFVKGLPEQLDTVVGERGIKFSGGQRQRIAIARALYYDPDILVLDEATSALDNETENAVMESIHSLQGKKTLIIVAHRLTTIKNCDKIYEIKDKSIILKDKGELFQ